MRVMLKNLLTVHGRDERWLRHDLVYDADWTPGWPRHPRHVRIVSRYDPKVYADIPITYLECVD